MAACGALAAAAVLGWFASPAAAHAIIDLDGVSAVAGTTSQMTLEVQHGCLPAEATLRVDAFVGRPWRGVEPGAVPGWQTTVERLPQGGWHIAWTNLGPPIPFGTAIFFPIEVAWPSKAGTYAMRVTQQCTNGASYDWNQQYFPATADSPSPPLTPRPEVKVVSRAEASTANAQPARPVHMNTHSH